MTVAGRSSTERLLVLVVEPDRDYRDILCAFLENEGYAVHRPRGPDEALDAVKRLRPSAIVGEHPLHLRDGRLLCVAIRDDPSIPHIPFIAITGHALHENLEEAARTHGCSVFVKPTDHSRVLAALDELVARAPADG